MLYKTRGTLYIQDTHGSLVRRVTVYKLARKGSSINDCDGNSFQEKVENNKYKDSELVLLCSSTTGYQLLSGDSIGIDLTKLDKSPDEYKKLTKCSRKAFLNFTKILG